MKKILLSLIFILGALSIFLYFNKEQDPYESATSNLTSISKEETSKRIDNSESLIVFVGRESCPYCVEFSEKLDEITDNYDGTIYYLDTENFTENDAVTMSELNVQYVPAIVKIVNGNPVLVDTDLSSTEISESLK